MMLGVRGHRRGHEAGHRLNKHMPGGPRGRHVTVNVTGWAGTEDRDISLTQGAAMGLGLEPPQSGGGEQSGGRSLQHPLSYKAGTDPRVSPALRTQPTYRWPLTNLMRP